MIHIERIAPLYATLTCPQIAAIIQDKPTNVRKAFSDHGIPDPKHEALEKRKRVVVKLFDKGWPIPDIAEQCECSEDAIRMLCKRMGLERMRRQLSLWDDKEFRVEAPPLKVVHVGRQKVEAPSRQLSLFPELVQHLMAA